MRVLYLNEFFWPDTAGRLLKELGRGWASKGHDVTVITMQPHYRSYRGRSALASRECVDGITILRVPAIRLPAWFKLSIVLNAFVFGVAAAIRGLRCGKHNLVVSGTMPPLICGFVGLLLARCTRARFIYHCQDIYPEAEEVVRRTSPRVRPFWTLVSRLLKTIDSWVMRRADAVVVLSADMVVTISNRGVRPERVAVINNPFMATEQAVAPVQRGAGLPDTTRLLFAGNVGRFQGLDLLVKAIAELPGELKIELLILGDGVAKGDLIDLVSRVCPARVRFHAAVPMSDVGKFVDEADYCVVSLLPGVISVAYPSKVMSYLGRGAPLFCILEPDSELGRLVRREGLGIVVPPADVDALRSGLREAAESFQQREKRSAAALRVGAEHFGPEVIEAAWLALFARVATNPGN